MELGNGSGSYSLSAKDRCRCLRGRRGLAVPGEKHRFDPHSCLRRQELGFQRQHASLLKPLVYFSPHPVPRWRG